MAHGGSTSIHPGDQRPAMPGTYAPDHTSHDHPGERTYIRVAIILACITVVEVVIYYVPWMRDHSLLVPSLLALSAVKFATVVGYFMHLKFDDRRLLWIFASGLAVAFSIIMALKALFYWHALAYAQKLFT